MKPSLELRISKTLSRLRMEYLETVLSKRCDLSIRELLNSAKIRLEDYCHHYRPNVHGAEMFEEAKRFGTRYEIWSDTAIHYMSCADYLFPVATRSGLLAIGKIFALDFYLNNTMGREQIGLLTAKQKNVVEMIRQRLLSFCTDSRPSPEAFPVERAHADLLIKIKKESPADWFAEFLREWRSHLEIALIDHNALALGYITRVDGYIKNRRSISGMNYTLWLVELGDDQYLPWPRLASLGLADPLLRLHDLVCDIGALMNDLFSFENEFIDCRSDANLISVIALNDPVLSLVEAIDQATAIVRGLLAEFLALIEETRIRRNRLQSPDKDLENVLDSHLRSLELMAQACWTWQLFTKRYRRQRSIWRETGAEYSALV